MEARDCVLDPARTVVASGVPDGVLPASTIVDKLTIHFQSRRRSDGGDVEDVRYPTNMDGVAFITFHHAEDADKVVKKERQIMTDSKFLQDYVLTVFPYSSDVFLYVSSATVDLSSLEGDQDSLIESLRSAHRSLRFKPLPRQRKASIEGPFSAVQVLREDLIRRAQHLKSSRHTDSVKIRAPSPSPKGIHHWEAPEANRSIAGENSVTGRFLDSGKKLGSPHGLKTFADDATTQFRQVIGAENSDGILPSIPKLNLHPAEDVFSKQHYMDVSRRYMTMDLLVSGGESQSQKYSKDLSSKTEFGLDKIPKYSDGEGSEELSVLLDNDTFQYLQKFHKKRLDSCLEGVIMCTSHLEGNFFVRVSLTEQPTARGASRIQEAAQKLQSLMKSCQSKLVVRTVFHNELHDKQKLAQICKDVNSVFPNYKVIYFVEDFCIRVIGPFVDCEMFHSILKDEISLPMSSP